MHGPLVGQTPSPPPPHTHTRQAPGLESHDWKQWQMRVTYFEVKSMFYHRRDISQISEIWSKTQWKMCGIYAWEPKIVANATSAVPIKIPCEIHNDALYADVSHTCVLQELLWRTNSKTALPLVPLICPSKGTSCLHLMRSNTFYKDLSVTWRTRRDVSLGIILRIHLAKSPQKAFVEEKLSVKHKAITLEEFYPWCTTFKAIWSFTDSLRLPVSDKGNTRYCV